MTTFLSDKDYKIVDKIVLENSDHPKSVLDALEEHVLPQLKQRRHVLDVGPGVGLITHKVAEWFDTMTLVEPNREMCRIHEETCYDIFPTSFQEVKLPKRYDLVLCSHMLYHVPLKEWPKFLDKLIDTVEVGGALMIAIIAPRGYNHDYYLQHVSSYRCSTQVIEYFKTRKIPFEVVGADYRFTTWTYDEMHTLCRFLTVEDLFPRPAYQKLSASKREEVEARISDYARTRQTPHGNFQLEHQGDYILFFKT